MAHRKEGKLKPGQGVSSGRSVRTGTGPAQAAPVVADDRYLALILQFPLRPIRTDDELDRAIALIDSLIDREPLGPEEEDYLDVLGDLVEKYEAEHHPITPVSDADTLRSLIEARDVTQAKVATDTGIAESTISEILSGRRGLNRRHIEVLAQYFRVPGSVFLSQ